MSRGRQFRRSELSGPGRGWALRKALITHAGSLKINPLRQPRRDASSTTFSPSTSIELIIAHDHRPLDPASLEQHHRTRKPLELHLPRLHK